MKIHRKINDKMCEIKLTVKELPMEIEMCTLSERFTKDQNPCKL